MRGGAPALWITGTSGVFSALCNTRRVHRAGRRAPLDDSKNSSLSSVECRWLSAGRSGAEWCGGGAKRDPPFIRMLVGNAWRQRWRDLSKGAWTPVRSLFEGGSAERELPEFYLLFPRPRQATLHGFRWGARSRARIGSYWTELSERAWDFFHWTFCVKYPICGEEVLIGAFSHSHAFFNFTNLISSPTSNYINTPNNSLFECLTFEISKPIMVLHP